MSATEPTGRRFVSYLRVSTDRQGRSGLGLEAQRQAVLDYLNGGQWELVAEFVEVESGKRSDNRPELAKALHACKVTGATLVVAKLDRLSRNVAFLAALMDAGAEFVACDFPQANRLTLHILAAVAEHERVMISQRTKAALQAAKARGVKLGNVNGTAAIRRAGKGNVDAVRAIKAGADARAADIMPIIADIRTCDPVVSLGGIARELNARGILTARGGRWDASRVYRLLQRREGGP